MRRIAIDDALCTGNGRCYALFPGLFADDERGYGKVLGDGIVDDEQLDDARRAVLACPELAISLEED